nr:hypothetical protein [Haloechinothrix halophila]
MDHVRLIRGERGQRSDIRRGLDKHDVARIDDELRDEVQCLLRADGHHHVVRVGGDAFDAHYVADLFPQPRLALSWPVLQCLAAVIGKDLADQRAEQLGRQRLRGRHAACQ